MQLVVGVAVRKQDLNFVFTKLHVGLYDEFSALSSIPNEYIKILNFFKNSFNTEVK